MGVAVASRTASLRAPGLVGAGGVALAAALLLRDPDQPGAWPRCPFLALTGVPCPGCGGLRALHDLLTGDVVAALSSNAWAVLTAVLCVGTYAAWLASRVGEPRADRWWGGRAGACATAWLSAHATVVAAVWAAGLVVFGVLRLLPPLSVLRP